MKTETLSQPFNKSIDRKSICNYFDHWLIVKLILKKQKMPDILSLQPFKCEYLLVSLDDYCNKLNVFAGHSPPTSSGQNDFYQSVEKIPGRLVNNENNHLISIYFHLI